jgi:hypothetical protein
MDADDPWARALRIYGGRTDFWAYLLATIEARRPTLGDVRARASVIEDLEDGWLQEW